LYAVYPHDRQEEAGFPGGCAAGVMETCNVA
jgi:hypothetical protein